MSLIHSIYTSSYYIADLQRQVGELQQRASVPGLDPGQKSSLETQATQGQQMINLFDVMRKMARDGINMSIAWMAGNREIGRGVT